MKFIPLLGLAALFASPVLAQSAPDADAPNSSAAFVPAKLDENGKAVVSGLNRFGLELYGKVTDERGDVAISPASISTAFGLAYAGARGQTADEIASILHYPDIDDVHGAFGALLKTMNLQREGRALTVNNALWLQDGLGVKPEYQTLVERHYGAGLMRVGYRADSEAARKRINGWVESKTNNKVRNLLLPRNVKSDTRSILVNTVYFKADWDDPFDKRATKVDGFTLASGKRVSRPLMNRMLAVAYAEAHGTKAVALRYRGGETEMVVLLPNKADGLAALEQALSFDVVRNWVAKLDGARQQVDVTLPRFRLEARLELKEAFKELGMLAAFSNRSDFSGMKVVNAESPDREDWYLKIDDVVHQVFVEVEERGTEAAAATAIGEILVTGGRAWQPKIFKADHPFLFLIRDRRTHAILFIGRYTGESA